MYVIFVTHVRKKSWWNTDINMKGKEKDEKTVKEIHESNKRHSDDYICSACHKYFLTQSTFLLKGAQRLNLYSLILESLLKMQKF